MKNIHKKSKNSLKTKNNTKEIKTQLWILNVLIGKIRIKKLLCFLQGFL